MSRVQRGYVNLDGGQIHYQAAGTDGPAIVLLHESPLSSQIFERTLPLLGDELRAFAFDTPGYGLSDLPSAPLDIPGYAALLLEAINRLGLDRFALAGAHTGAAIALEIAMQAEKGRVTHAILTLVPLLTEEERSERLRSWAPDTQAEADGSHLRWAWERFQRLWGSESPPELLNLGAMHIAANLSRWNSAYKPVFRYDPGPALQRLSCPLYLFNVEQNLVDTDARVLKIHPTARLTLVKGLKGQLPWRAPDVYARGVIDFVTS